MGTLFVLWLVFGIISAMVASNKGENGCLAAIIGFILGPIGLIIVIFTSGKRCPKCFSRIHTKAMKCPKCGTAFMIGE
ncbi:MAG: hypothetical protein WC602_06205 [archaeon]|jgi:hypothetical protein